MTTDAQTWVVMECRSGMTPVLAWCRWTGGPRFDDLVLTAMDGMSDAPEIDAGALRIERFLFQVEEGARWEPVNVFTETNGQGTGTVPLLYPPRAAMEFDPHAAVIMALTELGEDGVLAILAEQGAPLDVLADPTIITEP